MTLFEVGDIVRVRSARRRDAFFTVAQVGTEIVVARNPRGEARYRQEAFELVRAAATKRPPGLPHAGAESPPLPERVFDAAAVRLAPGESIDSAWRKFKKSCEHANVLNEVKRRRGFASKSEQRRTKSFHARRRRARAGL